MNPPSETSTQERLATVCSLAVFALICLLQMVKAAPFPQSDLLRDVVAYAWGFDYQRLYRFSPDLPTFDPYLGFDLVWGTLTRYTSPVFAAHTAQAVGALAYGAVVLCALKGTSSRTYRSALALFVILGTLVTGRLVEGRPEIVATIWLLSAASLQPWLWAVLGVFLAPAYWLLPIYAVGGFLLPTTWRGRVLATGVSGLGSAAFWFAYGGRNWLEHVLTIPRMAAFRVAAVPEAEPLLQLFHHPGTWLLVVLVLATVIWHRKELRESGWWVAIAMFLAIGSVRHILVLAPLMTLWALRQAWPAPPASALYGLFLAAIVSGVLAMLQLFPGDGIPAFHVPSGSVLLAGYNQGVFSIPFYNPGTVTVAPSVEAAWDGNATRTLAAAVSAGSLECAQLEGTPFTLVLGKARAPLRGACFHPLAESGKWILWKVGEGQTPASRH